MATDTDLLLPHLRLMQLVSPALPIGAFTYSQGIEFAVEAGWIGSSADLEDWLGGQMEQGLAYLELPVFRRLYAACANDDSDALRTWNALLLAARETSELRAEERNRGRALLTLLKNLGIPQATTEQFAEQLPHEMTQTAGFALAATHWQVPLADAATGFAWSWLENLVTAAVKLIPLGQSDGQRILLALAGDLPDIIDRGLAIDDDTIGAAAPATALASALHETQYTRLFRS